MDFVAGYGSDSDDGQDNQEFEGKPSILSSLPKPSTLAPKPMAYISLASLPPPKSHPRRVIKPHIDPKLLYDSDDDQPVKKKSKPSIPIQDEPDQGGGRGDGMGLASFLPPPTHASKARAADPITTYDFSQPPPTTTTTTHDTEACAPAYLTNDMYNLAATSMPPPPSHYASHYPPNADYAAPHPPLLQQQQGVSDYGPSYNPAPPPSEAELLLAAELEREQRRHKNTKSSHPGAMPLMKEIHATDIQRTDAPFDAHDGNRALQVAYGEQYEAKIRASAGPDQGKVAKRKHQIGSLLRDAKLAEIDHDVRRGQAAKTRANTAAKYGW